MSTRPLYAHVGRFHRNSWKLRQKIRNHGWYGLSRKVRRWLKIRDRVIERDGLVCRYCHEKIASKRDVEVDHVLPKCIGGGDNLNNLVVACIPCNQSKGGNLLSDKKRRQLTEENWRLRRAYDIREIWGG